MELLSRATCVAMSPVSPSFSHHHHHRHLVATTTASSHHIKRTVLRSDATGIRYISRWFLSQPLNIDNLRVRSRYTKNSMCALWLLKDISLPFFCWLQPSELFRSRIQSSLCYSFVCQQDWLLEAIDLNWQLADKQINDGICLFKLEPIVATRTDARQIIPRR